RPFTSGSGGAPGKQRVIVCYNCKCEGHMSKQCTKPKRKRDAEWFKDKEHQSHQAIKLSSPTIRLIKRMTWMELNSAKIALMANLSHYGSDNLTENSNLPKLQDDLILSVIEQLKTQVVNCTKINQDNKQVNELLTADLERELALEKQVKELNNIVFKRSQSAQTVYMLTKPQVFYNHSTRQALGFQNPCYLKKAQQLKPKLYDGRIIEKSDAVVIPDTEETLMLAEESRSKMIEKQNDPQMTEKKLELSAEQAFWSQYSVQIDEPNLSATTTIVEVPKELPKVSMQMELAVEQHCEEKNKFQNKMENILQENDRLLTQALSVEIMNVVVHDNVKSACLDIDVCSNCVTIESELKIDFLKKEDYETLLQKYHTLEKHCISLEVNNQLKMEIFQRNTLSSSESALTFAELFEINELKAQTQAKDTVILKLKEK
nr:hypothetical protein [Tanacetum cinerariifolium]